MQKVEALQRGEQYNAEQGSLTEQGYWVIRVILRHKALVGKKGWYTLEEAEQIVWNNPSEGRATVENLIRRGFLITESVEKAPMVLITPLGTEAYQRISSGRYTYANAKTLQNAKR